MLKIKSVYYFALSSVVLLTACFPGGFDTYEESDIVITDYNIEFDFSSISTYYMPDLIFYPDEDNPDRSKDRFILNELDLGFEEIGYTRVDTITLNNTPDIVVTVLVIQDENTTIYNNPWNPDWSIPNWGYPGYGWGYWGPSVISKYSVGTVLWTIWKPNNIDHENDIIPIEYIAAINGLMGASISTSEKRIREGIEQAFKQSPYLVVNN